MSTTRRIIGMTAAAAGTVALTALTPAAAAASAGPPPPPAAATARPFTVTITIGDGIQIGIPASQPAQDTDPASAPRPRQWQYLPARRTAPPARKIHHRHVRAYTAVTHPAARAVRWQAAARPAYTGQPQQIAQDMLGQYGWSWTQFTCLQPLWQRESGWDATAYNASSGAYGIPQALPAGKMASVGADWQSSPATQIRWGLSYIRDVYGTPCGAWAHEEADGWY
jgi:hypothetical protein